jgi:hypothetical protein
MKIKAYRSPDKRLRTENFRSSAGMVFCIAEPMAWGTLISRFKTNGEIVDRVENQQSRSTTSALETYFAGFATLEVEETGRFEHVKAQAVCSSCGGDEIEREQDGKATEETSDAPVIPIFTCLKCGSRFCLLGDDYVKNMISRFSRYIAMGKGENADNAAFIGEVRDNIIRSFASQNIRKLEIKATA